MKPTLGDEQNESTGVQWPRTLKVEPEEFRQCYAAANLAVKLCELKKANSRVPLEKENLEPEKFLDEAWKLIESAREHVSRSQTDVLGTGVPLGVGTGRGVEVGVGVRVNNFVPSLVIVSGLSNGSLSYIWPR